MNKHLLIGCSVTCDFR